MSRLTPKQKRFAKAKAEGKSDLKAYKEAGYSTRGTDSALRANAFKLKRQDKVQQAIDDALEFHGATPEFAVGQLKRVAENPDQLGAARLASMNIIELHGWNKKDKPHVTLAIKSNFFTESREEPIDVEASENLNDPESSDE